MGRFLPGPALGLLVLVALLSRDAADPLHLTGGALQSLTSKSQTVYGRVLGADGKPRLDATVSLIVDGVPMASTGSGLGGRYHLPIPHSLSKQGSLHIQAPGLARYVQPVVVGAAQTQRLRPGYVVSGGIQGEISGAEIRAIPLDAARDADTSTSEHPYSGTIYEDGSFLFEHLPRGDYELSLHAEGRASPPPILVAAGDRDLVIRVPTGKILKGKVLSPAGDGVVGARVLVGGAFYWPAREVRTGQGGRFAIPGVEPGDVDLWARAEQWAAPVREGIPFSGDASGELIIQLSGGGVVKGIVHDGSRGDAIPSAKLSLAPAWPATLAIRTESGPAGHFSFGAVSPGRYLINVWAEGFAPLNAHPIDLRADTPVIQGISLSMSRGASLDVEVLDEHKRPVEGARASVTVTGATGRRSRFDGRRSRLRSQLWRTLRGGISRPWRGERGFLTNSTGQATVPGLPAGHAVVAVSSPAHSTSHSDPVELVDGQVARIQVRLRRGIPLIGRVLNVDGEGIERAKVSLGGSSPASARTDAKGAFRLVGVAGEATLEVAAPGYPLHSQTVELKAGRLQTPLEVTLAREGAVVKGWVLNTQGGSVARVEIRLRGPEGGAVETTTDRRGAFELLAPVKGPYRLTARHPQYAPITVKDVRAGGDLTLTLSPGGTLEAEVLDGDYDPVKGAEVLAVGPVTPAAVRVGEGGVVRFERLPVGLYRLDVRARAMVSARREGIAVVEDEITGPIRIVMEDAGNLSGKVVDQDNVGLKGVRVVLSYREGEKAAAKTVTKADGAFHFADLPAGDVVLRASAPGWEEADSKESVVAGESYEDVTIYLSRL